MSCTTGEILLHRVVVRFRLFVHLGKSTDGEGKLMLFFVGPASTQQALRYEASLSLDVHRYQICVQVNTHLILCRKTLPEGRFFHVNR